MADQLVTEPILTNGHLRLRQCRHGVMLYNLNDTYVGTMLDKYGEFSEGETDLFRQVLRSGMTAVEVGANIGAHTVSIAHFVGPRGRVLAIEPQRSIFQLLCANLALNRIEHVEAHWAAAGSAPGTITVPRLDSRERQNFGRLALGGVQQGDQVRLVTLDSFELPACHLIKIDVEGMEADVIRGACDTIRRHSPVIYAENDRAEKSPALIQLLQELDYRCYWHLPAYVRVPNFRNDAENRFPNKISVNLLCFPRSRNAVVNGFREVTGPQDDWRTQKADKASTTLTIAAAMQRAVANFEGARLTEAARYLRTILDVRPDHFNALHLVGIIAARQGDYAGSAATLRKAIGIDFRNAEAHRNLGLTLSRLRQFDEAITSYRQAIEIKPDYIQPLLDLGVVYTRLRRWDDAIASHRRALALNPDTAAAHYGLALALAGGEHFDAALASCRRALELQPDLPGALPNAVLLAHRMCDWTAMGVAVQALAAAAGRVTMGVFPLLSVIDDPDVLHRAAARFRADRIPPAPAHSWSGHRPAHDRIRVAYLSADFHEHATAYLMAGLFEQHDRSRFEIFAVSLGSNDGSAMRQRLVQAFDHFIDARLLSDAEVATELRRLEIDIAVDLKGYTKDSRPGIAALRPAPVQVNYLGYPGTMGAEFIDYILVDRFIAPPEHQPFFTEKLVHLPACYQVNDRNRAIAAQTPSRDDCGLPGTGFVFCSFNNSYKIAPAIFDIWMRLLHAVPGSVLWLLEANRWAKTNLRREAQARGVAPDRLVFAPRVGLAEHLARHRLADLFLDTLPCNAHTTASDALWAGLPVLTCAGRSFAARVAGSLLHAIGLPELVTHTLTDYEALALKLARQPAMLEEIKVRLAANCLTTPLFDTDRFRQHIEAAYTEMWNIWQRGEPPRAFAVETR